MTFWKKLKNWRNYLISWLGGITKAEHKAALLQKDKERGAIVQRLRTVTLRTEAKFYGPIDGINTMKSRARKEFAMCLGNSLIDHAQHFLTDDGKYYLVCLTIFENDYSDV